MENYGGEADWLLIMAAGSLATGARSGVSCPGQAWAWTNQSVFELTKGEGQEKMEVSF